jgi:hypothetical protein
MEKGNEKKSTEEQQQPGSMSSFNNREENREGSVEEVKEHKDASESYMDYNGNSEANAPARAREGDKE